MGCEQRTLHVHDLPQLYQKPDTKALLETLKLLALDTTAFGNPSEESSTTVFPEGIPDYLTRIVSSPLLWIDDEDEREAIWDMASQRLAQRSGRTAMGDMVRTFSVPFQKDETVDIAIHEPALTGDNLGLKTWGSAFVLAKQLYKIKPPPSNRKRNGNETVANVLELGAGTGLVGIAAAVAWHASVVVTDLPEIVTNTRKNITLNKELLEGLDVRVGILDWTMPTELSMDNSEHVGDQSATPFTAAKFHTIIAADSIYSPEHPRLLTNTIQEWLADDADARVITAYPFREAYHPQIHELRELMSHSGFQAVEGNTEVGRDDWKDDVLYQWNVWGRR